MMRARFGWLLTLGLLGLFATAPQAFAATFTVTSPADSGAGSLRDTIAGASSGDTINFGVTGLITLTSGPLLVTPDLTISGPGASSLTISGGGNSQVFDIRGSVTISGLTLEDGSDFQGGAIFNGGTLSLNDCVLSSNTTPLDGGAVWNDGALTVNGSTFSGNSATTFGGFGGAIVNFGTLSVSNSTFSGNSADQQGGAIWSELPLSVSASTFSGNSATFNGGAIWAFDTLTVINSTFSGNSSGSLGGAIANEFAMNLSDSTFSGNSAAGGGGIWNDFATVAAKGNLLASNSPDNCEDDGGGLVSQGYNLSSDASCATSFTMTGDLNSTAAGLAPAGLADNGGPTQTIALLSTSAAVDAIPVADCTDVSGNTVSADQRGVSRPQGAGCDIGAFEFENTSVPFSAFDLKLSIDSTAPGFSLKGTFTLGAASDGINPLTEPVTITLGTYSVTIPPSSFKQQKNGTFMYQGTIGGVNLVVQIVPLGGASYQIKANGSPVNLSGLTNPVTVTLVIGNDSGATSVMANL